MSKEVMSFTDGHGRRVTREINQVINVKDFLGTPGYSSLVVAANTHLSVNDVRQYLDLVAEEIPGVARSRSWIQRRRWLYQQPGKDNSRNRDGKDARAIRIMAEHPSLSVYKLSALLSERGITRSREWVRQHRCDGMRAAE